MAEVSQPNRPKKAKKGKKGRKHGRYDRKPANLRYRAERRWEKNKARRARRRAKQLPVAQAA
jgi:hypothetical protein